MQRSHRAQPWAREPVCGMCKMCCSRGPCQPRPDAMPQNFRYEQLLQSIVEEEAALARLVNQEAMKTQKIAQNISGQFTPDEVITLQRSLASVLYNIQKKEELLIKKMRLVFDAQKKCEAPYFQEPRID